KLERANQQGEHAAEHMHAEGELMLEVRLPLHREVDLGVERQVPRCDDGNRDAGQGHDHPAWSGQPAGEPALRAETDGCGAVAAAHDGAHGVLTGFSLAAVDASAPGGRVASFCGGDHGYSNLT